MNAETIGTIFSIVIGVIGAALVLAVIAYWAVHTLAEDIFNVPHKADDRRSPE